MRILAPKTTMKSDEVWEGTPLIITHKNAGSFSFCCRLRTEVTKQIDSIFVRPTCENDHGPRFEALDGLRACAFLWVVMYHVLYFQNDWSVTWSRPFRHLSAQGWCGVSIFLALSGFLMSLVLDHVLQKAYGTGIRGYFLSTTSWFAFRFARIWPVYAAAVFISQVIVARIEGTTWWSGCGTILERKEKIKFWLRLLGLKQNWLTRVQLDEGCITSPFWSIALECQFYAILPFFAFPRLRYKATTAFSVLVTIVILLWYRYNEAYDRALLLMEYFPSRLNAARTFIRPGMTSVELYYRTSFRAAEFFMGVLSYYVYDAINSVKAQRRTVILKICEFFFLCGLISFGVLQYVMNLALRDNNWLLQHPVHEAISLTIPGSIVAFSTAAIIPCLTIGGNTSSYCVQILRKVLSSRVLYPVASLSYTGYLMCGVGLAIELFRVLPYQWSGTPIEGFLAFLALTMSLGAVLSLLVERPCVALARVLLNRDKRGSKVASLESVLSNTKLETRVISTIIGILFSGCVALSVCTLPSLQSLWNPHSWQSLSPGITLLNSTSCMDLDKPLFMHPKSELLAVDIEGKPTVIPYMAPEYEPTRVVFVQHGKEQTNRPEIFHLRNQVYQEDFVLAELSNETKFDPSEIERVVSELHDLFPSTREYSTYAIGWGDGADTLLEYACGEQNSFAAFWLGNATEFPADCSSAVSSLNAIFHSSASSANLARSWAQMRQCGPLLPLVELSPDVSPCIPASSVMESDCGSRGRVTFLSEPVSSTISLKSLFNGGFAAVEAAS